jgi:molybdopterin converting factor small subunit
MKGVVEVYLYGSLGMSQGQSRKSQLQSALQAPTPLIEFLNRLDIPRDKVQLVMVNHRAVQREHVIRPGDRVALFPIEYPVYPDWKDFR